MFLLEGHAGAVRALGYSHDGLKLASASEDGWCLVWDLTTRTIEQSYLSPSSNSAGFEAVWFGHPTGRVYGGDETGAVYEFEPGGNPVWKMSGYRNDSPVRSLQGSAKSDKLFILRWSGVLCVCDCRDFVLPIHVIDPPESLGPILTMALAEDGERFLTFTSGGLQLFDLRERPRHRVVGDASLGGKQLLRFDPTDTLVAACDLDGSMKLLDARGWQVRAILPSSSAVYGLAFTPDGRRLVSGGADGTVRVWDVRTGEPLHVFEWHRKWVTCLAMSPDGTTVATGSEDSTIAVWDMPD
jgi:WD40 repeat protein